MSRNDCPEYSAFDFTPKENEVDVFAFLLSSRTLSLTANEAHRDARTHFAGLDEREILSA